MGLCFGLLFPFGGIVIRFLSSFLPKAVKVHYMIQLLAFALVLIAGGLGVYLSDGLQLSTFRIPPFSPRSFSRILLRSVNWFSFSFWGD